MGIGNTHSYFLEEPDVDHRKMDDQNFRHIKRFATWISTVRKMNLELISFKWTGALGDDAKQNAAANLDRVLSVDGYKDAHKVMIGHSHGCNVINNLSRYKSFETNPIEMIIALACPVIRDEEYKPKNYKMLLYFYSDSDVIIAAGRKDYTQSQLEL